MIYDNPNTVYVYNKETGQYSYRRSFADGESPGPSCDTTTVKPQLSRTRNGELAFFRNGQWEYEPDPNWEVEEKLEG